MDKPIQQLVDELPTNNLTISALRALDFIPPGEWQSEWQNIVGFVNTIKIVTGETDEDIIQQIGERAIYLYNDRSRGYRRVMWIYQTVDNKAIGAAALVDKVGEGNLRLHSIVIPNAKKEKAINLCVKLVAEVVAFCWVNNIPGDSIGDFTASLRECSAESRIRMVALACFDGLIPIGLDFLTRTLSWINQIQTYELERWSTFQRIQNLIPGTNSEGKLAFIRESFDSVKGWMDELVSSHGLSPEKVAGNLQGCIDFSGVKFDDLGAFLNASTNYYEHTGTQTIARHLIERAVAEI